MRPERTTELKVLFLNRFFSNRSRMGIAALGLTLATGLTVAERVLAEPPEDALPPTVALEAEVDDGLATPGQMDPKRAMAAEIEIQREIAEGRIPNPDPWENFNRRMFRLNEQADVYGFEPAARAWRFITPSILRKGIDNFNALLLMPVVLGNGILQLKPLNAVQDIARIVYNATFGLAGLIDVATMVGIPQNDEDFGQTLGYWGVPSGPYVVMPFFGPSTIRGSVGRLGDSAGTYYFSLLPIWATFMVRGIELVNLRARFLDEFDENRRESFDYYVFLRDAYLQNRRARIGRARGENEMLPGAGDDLYYFDDEEEWDMEDSERAGDQDGSGVQREPDSVKSSPVGGADDESK
ncbi:MAG: VacJ family lipoprotein [Myxococcota bacterium]|nr:VacJ family lipoprotein [Myxococcota bacterium]